MLNADFPAETANKRPSLVDILSGPAPRSPVRAARFDASPHIILTWAYLRLLKFLLSEAKRLFQQYRPKADIACRVPLSQLLGAMQACDHRYTHQVLPGALWTGRDVLKPLPEIVARGLKVLLVLNRVFLDVLKRNQPTLFVEA